MMSYFTVLFTASFKNFLNLAFIGRLGEQLHSRAEGRFPFCLAGVRVTGVRTFVEGKKNTEYRT